MADDLIFIVHKRAGLAICAAKQLGNDWRGRTNGFAEAWYALVSFLGSRNPLLSDEEQPNVPSAEQHRAWWDSYMSGLDEFLLVQETTFRKTWTTPSGTLYNDSDYVQKDLPIFRVFLLERDLTPEDVKALYEVRAEITEFGLASDDDVEGAPARARALAAIDKVIGNIGLGVNDGAR